jgi:nucleoside-diphosphate kinase
MVEETLLLIKPNITQKNKIGAVVSRIEDNGFEFVHMKLLRMDHDLAAKFYGVHKDKPFYEELIDFMMSGKTIAAVLRKENAIENLRELVGNTDPSKAAPGTIRHDYGDSLQKNAVHASDCFDSAKREIKIIFSETSN